MKNNQLFKTNLLISVILVVGFLLTAVLSCHVSRQPRFCLAVGLSCLLIGGMILAILLIINSVIRRFNTQVTELVEERQAYFKQATEQLYESIYEMNLTQNCYVGKTTEEYFKSLGAGGLPFDQGSRRSRSRRNSRKAISLCFRRSTPSRNIRREITTCGMIL